MTDTIKTKFSFEEIKDMLRLSNTNVLAQLQAIFFRLAFAGEETLGEAQYTLQQLKSDLHNHTTDGVMILNQAILDLNKLLVESMHKSVGGKKKIFFWQTS